MGRLILQQLHTILPAMSKIMGRFILQQLHTILPAMSKIMGRFILQQLHTFCDNILSKYQCGFRKHFSSQQCLILMVEKWKQTFDSKGVSVALLTDLSEAFDCLEHDLIIAKLNAYGFGYKALKIIRSYLVNRQQRVKVNSSYSA